MLQTGPLLVCEAVIGILWMKRTQGVLSHTVHVANGFVLEYHGWSISTCDSCTHLESNVSCAEHIGHLNE